MKYFRVIYSFKPISRHETPKALSARIGISYETLSYEGVDILTQIAIGINGGRVIEIHNDEALPSILPFRRELI